MNAKSKTQHATGAHRIWEVLLSEGVDTVFGYPGGAIMPAYDAMADFPIHHVLTRHEQGAAHMADGYARATGRLGVAIATSGPGATNLVTGLATAMLDSVPVLCITGQVPSSVLGTNAFQEVDVVAVTRPVTKHNRMVTRPDEIGDALREASYIAQSGRPGPVLVDITKDAQQGLATEPLAPRRPIPTPSQWVDPEAIRSALDLLSKAERPLILSGQGVIMANATHLLREFAEAMDIPVSHTLLGLGAFPTHHPLYLGMAGMHGHAWVNEAIQGADVLLAIGLRFDDRVTGRVDQFARSAKIIHVELDPKEIGKIIEPTVAVQGDARAVLRRLLADGQTAQHTEWRTQVQQWKAASEERDILQQSPPKSLNAPRVLDALSRLTQGDAIIVTDVGQHQMWEAQYVRHDRPRSLITSGGLGTMGFALPAAIGAKLARPEAEVWVVVGDGGFQMTACELSTCAQEGLNLNIAVVNNGYLGMVRQWQEFFYNKRYVETPIGSPDFSALARCHGLHGLTVRHWDEVEAAMQFARSTPGTCVLDIRVEPEDSVFPMVAPGKDLSQMLTRPDSLNPSTNRTSS